MRWAVLGTLLAVVNPLGPKLLVFPLGLLSNREAFDAIAEWGRPTWTSPGEWFFALELVLAVVACLVWRRRWRVALPILLFGAAALMSVRNIAPASLVLVPGLAASLASVGTIDGGVRLPRLRPVAVALVVLAILMSSVSILTDADTNLSAYPEEATTWMRDQGLLDVEDRVVSRDFVGNYWEARFGPDQVRVYMDDRVDMYPIELIRDYTVLVRPGGDYGLVLRRAQASAVLWDRDSDLGRWLEQDTAWRIVHRDADWLVALPR